MDHSYTGSGRGHTLSYSPGNQLTPATGPVAPPPLGPAPQNRLQAPPPPPIGMPVHFIEGQLAGQTVRAVLTELQKADRGRKYAIKDRRPIDPPPVVQLRLFRVLHVDKPGQTEVEYDYDDIHIQGLVCHVDLFPGPNPPDVPESRAASAPATLAYPEARPSAFQGGSRVGGAREAPWGAGSVSAPAYPGAAMPSQLPTPTTPIPEHTKLTDNLAGATFTQAAKVELSGRSAVVFVFGDLSVKLEGTFVLRYRCFDILSRVSGPAEKPALAEIAGGPFQIYSTKEFPGLLASTDLTRHLARRGVRTNNRESERARIGPPDGTSGSRSRSRKRKAEDLGENDAGAEMTAEDADQDVEDE